MGTGLNKSVCDILREDLPLYDRRGPGGTYKYHKGSDVIRQLNKAFGHTWSSEVIREIEKYDQVLVLVSLTVWVEGDTIIHHGYGSAPIAKNSSSGKVIDIGNSYKSAYTGALKKAAEQFGIGLGGSEDDEDSGDRDSSAPPPPAPRSLPTRSAPASAAPVQPNRTSGRPPISRPAPLPSRNTSGGGATPAVAGLSNTQLSSLYGSTPEAPAPAKEPAAAAAEAPFENIRPAADAPINPNQKTALLSLSEIRGIDEPLLVQGALQPTTKTSFDELTMREAIAVIRYANNLITTPKG